MRRTTLISTFGITSLLCLGSAAQAQNLLTNGNMDATSISGQVLATPTSWNAFALRFSTGPFNDAMSSEPWCNVADAGGFGVFFKPFSGGAITANNKVTAHLYQDVPGTPGLNYTLTGWAGAESGYVGLTDPTVGSTFSIQFLNGANAVIGTATLDLVSAGLGVGAPTPPMTGENFKYHPFSLSAVAPAGTVSVRSMVSMIDAYGGSGAQAFVVDNFSLVVPEPTSLAAVAGLALVSRRRRA